MDTSVNKFMSHNIISVLWTDHLQEAYEVMAAHKFRHLPVISEKNEVVGIISDRDFHRAMQIDQADYFSRKVATAAFDPQALVRDYMSSPIQTIPLNSTVAESAKLMLDKKISAVFVSNEAEIVGILTTDDMLRALIEALTPNHPHSIKERFMSAFFNSPVNEFVDLANQAGI